MATKIWVNIGSGNGLLPDGTKPLPEPMLTDHHWNRIALFNSLRPCDLRTVGYCHALGLFAHPSIPHCLPLYSPQYFTDALHIWLSHWSCMSMNHIYYSVSMFIFVDAVALWNFMNTLTDWLFGLDQPSVSVFWTIFFCHMASQILFNIGFGNCWVHDTIKLSQPLWWEYSVLLEIQEHDVFNFLAPEKFQ